MLVWEIAFTTAHKTLYGLGNGNKMLRLSIEKYTIYNKINGSIKYRC